MGSGDLYGSVGLDEIIGFEKIPDDGAAIIVYYHGAVPIDLYYMVSKCILHKNRHPRVIGDRFLFMIPGNNQYDNLFN